MSDNGSHSTDPTPRLLSPIPCPPTAPCTNPDEQTAAPETYEATQLSNAEAAELVKARIAVDQELSDARPRLDAATAELRAEEGASALTLHALNMFTQSRELADRRAGVTRIWARHANDGPEDRRRRPGWVRWVQWPAVIAAGLYDTAFLAQVFLKLVDMNLSTNPASWIALVPGAIIVVAFLVVAHWIGEAMVRARAHSERSKIRDRLLPRMLAFFQRAGEQRKREQDDLPWPRWPIALLFGLLVVSTMAIWAYIRAVQAQDEINELLNFAFAMLLLMFTLTAIAVKVISHNPYADAEKDAGRRADKTSKRHDGLVTEAVSAVGRFDTANQTLNSLLDEVAASTDRHMDLAWVRILELRDMHRLAGTVAPTFACRDNVADSNQTDQPRCGDRHPLFDGVAEPPVTLALLASARQHLRTNEVAAAQQRLITLLTDLSNQCNHNDAR
jgi:hypothetical protein